MNKKNHIDRGTSVLSNRLKMTRRDFLAVSGAAAAGVAISGCSSFKGRSAKRKGKVAIAQAGTYDRQILHREIQDMFDKLGGIQDIIKPGSKVAIKVNLTGGLKFSGELAKNAINAHWTHPEVVRAVGEALIDAGAKELIIMDGVFDDLTYETAGYPEVAAALGAQLIDLNSPAPYGEFIHQNVGEGWYAYESFVFHPFLNEVDAFVSIPKMKCHNNTGVTLALKNHIGLAPVQYYGLKEKPDIRSALHGLSETFGSRLPRVIIDLVRARPIELTVIDGVKTAEGGEGPWIKNTFGLVEPGVLVAGKDPVATDSVATAVMGFDPAAGPYETPFVSSDNHLALACERKLGTNRLEDIDIVGAKLEKVVFPFKPCKKGGHTISGISKENNLPYNFLS